MSEFGSDSFRPPIFKRIDDPWIGLLVLSIFIFVSSIIALIILCLFWRRHKKRNEFYNESIILSNRPAGRVHIPIQTNEQNLQPYETQKMEVFVPTNNGDKINAHFPVRDDVEQIHRYYERTTRAYF